VKRKIDMARQRKFNLAFFFSFNGFFGEVCSPRS